LCLRSLERSGAEFSVDLIPPGRPYNALGVRQVADDFAAEGYITLGVDLYSEQVLAFEAALTAAGIENDVDIYDAVGHGFWLRIDDDVDVRSAAGLDAWTRLKSFLDRNLRD
jgi:dienelactone hydrolase